jgi:hypothetical protein
MPSGTPVGWTIGPPKTLKLPNEINALNSRQKGFVPKWEHSVSQNAKCKKSPEKAGL